MCEEQELIGGLAFSSGRGLAVDRAAAINSRADGTAVQGALRISLVFHPAHIHITFYL